MNPQLAVIDIGSNSVRLMLGTKENGRVRALSKTLWSTRLASGIDETHRLRDDRVEETVRAIASFRKEADAFGIPVLAYATSAVRDAENRGAFLAAVKAGTGLDVLVLSGEEEGNYAFSSVTGGEGTVFDIGGGSFQVVTKNRSVSFPCGCVRAKAVCDACDFKTLERELFAWIDGIANLPETVPQPVYGVGGTITSIGALLAGQTRYDGQALSEITLDALDRLLSEYCAIPEAERMEHPLLVQKRGDIILQGMTILRYLMIRTHPETVSPSDRDGMEGIAQALL